MRELNDRERIIVIGGGIAVFLMAVIGLGVIPFMRASSRTEVQLQELRDQVKLVRSMHEKITAAKTNQASSSIPRPPGNFKLLTFLENLATEARIREKIKTMKPDSPEEEGGVISTEVQIKLESLNVEELVSFIYKIEKNRVTAFSTKKLAIKNDFKNEKLLDVDFVIVNYQPAEL